MKFFLSTLALAGALLSSGCASIVSHSRWPVAVSSAPAGATVSIVNRRGQEVFSGVTPAAVQLKSGSSFFNREKYTLKFTMPGYDPKTAQLEADVNGWYFGNIVFGGFIGLLIVDPATGAMYRIAQKEVQVALSQTQGFNNAPGADPNGLQILSITQIPANQRHLLIPVPAR